MKQKTILAVDDDQDSLDLVRETLGDHDFKVIFARSGPEAVRILRTMTPHLVILDIMMPDMNGFALLDIIRSTPSLKDIPVIMQTAYPSQEHGRRAINSGLDYMLCKPLRLDVLVSVVKRCIKNGRAAAKKRSQVGGKRRRR